jgi:pyruvate formate lyase activating enzyme
VVKAAKERNSIGIAYTYNEPFIWFEFVKETSELARKEGFVNVLVTNGYVNPQPLAELLPLTDAANVDIKSIREDFYKRLCKAKLRPVLDTCIALVKADVHLEVTNLIIPGENDTDDEFRELSSWICDNLGKMTPVHLSAYFPHYKFTAPPTPAATLERAYEIFSKLLPYTYLGNVRTQKGSSTLCPACSAELISRRGYDVKVTGLDGRKCANCGREIEIAR